MPVSEDKPSPKSNRRRRWEVKSKESFETSLAVELESPQNIFSSNNNSNYNSNNNNNNNKKRRPQTAHSVLSKKNNFDANDDDDDIAYAEEEKDIVSAKLSALLENAIEAPKNNVYHQQLRDSEENLINSELKNYFGQSSSAADPSAPPLSPENIVHDDQVDKMQKKKVSMKVSPVHVDEPLVDSKVTEQLKHLRDDIKDNKQIELNNESAVPTITVSGLLLGPSSSSFNGNVSTIYCERLNNFVVSENYCSRYQNEPQKGGIKTKNTRKSYAVSLQTGFRTFSILCQGLVGGLTLAHCLMIFLMEEETDDILIEKKAIEHVFFALIFFLSTFCLVSSFDRCDVAGQGVFSEHGIRIPWTPLFYFISLTLTLITIKVEDLLTHFDAYPPETQSNKGNLTYWWKFVCLSRTIFALLAWVAIIKDPHTDALNSRVSEFPDD